MTRFRTVIPRLPVTDLRATIAFYTDVLGFKLGLLWPENAPTFTILDRDHASIQFCIDTASKELPLERATLCFNVDDVKALHADLKGRVAVEWGPEIYWYGRREFAIRDPDGYMLIFSEQTDDQPTCHEER